MKHTSFVARLIGSCVVPVMLGILAGCGGGDGGGTGDSSASQNGGDAGAPDVPTADGFVPGSSVGLVALGDTYAHVTSIYGEPGTVFGPDSVFGLTSATFSSVGLTVAFASTGPPGQILANDRVSKIMANRFFTGTYCGICNGSDRSTVIGVLGESSDPGNGQSLIYLSEGILFTIHDGKVDGFMVFYPIDL